MYIERNDFRSRITISRLDLMVEKDETIMMDAIRFAQGIIEGYLGSIYVLSEEWAKTGIARNYQVLNWALNLACYLLYQRTPDADVPQKVIKNHDDTISELSDISKGKTRVNLPLVENTDGEVITARRIGSKPARSHDM